MVWVVYPLFIKSSELRNAASVKCFIAVFVWIVTKSIHIELVSGLSFNDFILTLKQFKSTTRHFPFFHTSKQCKYCSKLSLFLWNPIHSTSKSTMERYMRNSYERPQTLYVLSQIEALMNFRTLCVLYTDLTDLICLTPGLFCNSHK